MKAKLNKSKNYPIDKVNNIINHLKYLKLGNIDEELGHIINGNVSHFITDSSVPSNLKLIGELGFTAEKSGDSFSVEFIPSLINPSSISIKHTALDGNWQDAYEITFVPDMTDTVSIVCRKINRGVCVSSRRKETIYINGQKLYEQQYLHKIGSNDNSYSQTQTTCYSSLNNSLVKETIAIGEPAALIKTGRSFMGGTEEDMKVITSDEFACELQKFMKEKAKVFTFRKNGDI